MSNSELLDAISARGGRLFLDGGRLCARRVPPELAALVRCRARELAALLSAFPHCGRCGSHAIYRHIDGSVQCLTCAPSPWDVQ